VAFFVVLLVFGGLVEMRSALLSRRMGDLDCFLRAGWAVRTGGDLYSVTDDNGFHYNYPPLLAVLVAPLADPPAGADRAGMLPFGVSAALWYLFNLACLALAVHLLAGALERGCPPRPGSRRWWALRFWPVLACLVPVGHTLMRGQSNLLVLALLAASLAAQLSGARFRAGLWLAGAACLKIFPAFLFLFPLWRRDRRCLAGCACGLAVGLLAIPAAGRGLGRTLDDYGELTEVLVMPGLGAGADTSRAAELTDVTVTDSQSILAALHSSLHPDPARRPVRPSGKVRLASYALGGLLTALTLLAARRRAPGDRPGTVLLFGLLTLDMLLLCPVCHLHYFCLAIPAVMALVAARWEGREAIELGVGLVAFFALVALTQLLPHFPPLVVLRERGLAGYGALALWVVGVVTLWRRGKEEGCPPSSFAGRLLRGVRVLRSTPRWAEHLPPDWAETIMQVEVTDRFFAKQGRTIARWALKGPAGELVVYLKRHYRLPWWHGVLALLRPGASWSPGMQEWEHLEWARSAGLPVPEALAAGEWVGPWGRLRSFLVVEELTSMLPLHEAVPLAKSRLDGVTFRRWKQGLLREMVSVTLGLHSRRRFHKDLYLCHFYVAEEDTARLPDWRGRVRLIDLHRLGHHPWAAPWWRAKDLAQLLYSSDVPGVTPRDRLEFWRAYREAAGLGRAPWLGRWVWFKAWNNWRRRRRRAAGR
jgi:heptose I phosphotransferase